MVGLKRQFDGMTQALQQIEPLREQVSELQERFDQLPTFSNSLDDVETPNGVAESVSVDDAETVKQFFERVEQQQRQESLASTESVVHPAEVEVNADATEAEKDEEIDAVVEEQNPTTFNDEEFKTERIMWLLNRIYVAEEESHETPITAEEFLRRYKAGERDFAGINLAGADLSGNSLGSLNLSQANLNGANLSCLSLSSVNLSRANLRAADLSKAKLDSTNLSGAKLNKANLKESDLQHINISSADLSGANLTSADLREAALCYANLEKANLKGANISGANLEGAKLSGAIMPDGTTHE
jgi:uncharacterized protein YjbI with pentapeptide repeats